MRALKDELEQALEQADEFKMRMLEETRRREEVCVQETTLATQVFVSLQFLQSSYSHTKSDFIIISLRIHFPSDSFFYIYSF